MKKNIWRAVIEVGFIIFLFYSNLLMGEFERSGMGQKRGLAWAIGDIFTAANFEIGMIAGLIGYMLCEFLRKRFSANVALIFGSQRGVLSSFRRCFLHPGICAERQRRYPAPSPRSSGIMGLAGFFAVGL